MCHAIEVTQAIEQQQADAPDTEHALQNLLNSYTADVLKQAIQKLPIMMQQVIVLFYFSECSQQTIASILDVSVRTVEAQLYRARQKLRNCLVEPYMLNP